MQSLMIFMKKFKLKSVRKPIGNLVDISIHNSLNSLTKRLVKHSIRNSTYNSFINLDFKSFWYSINNDLWKERFNKHEKV